MTDEEAKELIIKYNSGQCTESEKALIEDWFMQHADHDHGLSQKRIEELGKEIRKQLPKADIEESTPLFNEETDQLPPRKNLEKRVKLIKIISGIAALLFLWYGNYLYITADRKQPEQEKNSEIRPGSNRASLKLSNGKTINLSNAKTGVIIDAGDLIYNDGTPIENHGDVNGKQTLTTPKGGQYQVVFKDGTKIWLNAASTLTFETNPSLLPTRDVSLSGEAYFEIAKNKDKPFRVVSNGQIIEVLGTHFNVTAYEEDGNTKTTLLEGSVRVSSSRQSEATRDLSTSKDTRSLPTGRDDEKQIILKPGEQSTLKDSKITVEKVDTDNAVAWKNGEFTFRNETLKEIMPKLARWYDVEISYENQTLANKHFGGTISKFENVSEVLNMLELTGDVKFKIEGRRIKVMP